MFQFQAFELIGNLMTVAEKGILKSWRLIPPILLFEIVVSFLVLLPLHGHGTL